MGGTRVEPSPGFWFNLSYDQLEVTSFGGSWERDERWFWCDPKGHVHRWATAEQSMVHVITSDVYFDVDGEEYGPDFEWRCAYCGMPIEMKNSLVYATPSVCREYVAGLPQMTCGWTEVKHDREHTYVAEFMGSRAEADLLIAVVRATKGETPRDLLKQMVDDASLVILSETKRSV
jgi:hypothetical protein